MILLILFARLFLPNGSDELQFVFPQSMHSLNFSDMSYLTDLVLSVIFPPHHQLSLH